MAAKFIMIQINVETPQQQQQVTDAVQKLVSQVGNNNLILLSEKVQKNPSLIKTALKFI